MDISCITKSEIMHLKESYSISKMDEIARLKFTDSYEVLCNTKEDYAIVFKRHKTFGEPIPNLNYFVYSIRENKIVLEDALSGGNIFWADDYKVEATEREQKAESPIKTYIYDLKRDKYKVK